MRMRQEVRRLSENLGTEIREALIRNHNCNNFRISKGMCIICDLSRIRGMELAVLALCRKRAKNLEGQLDRVLYNESELIDLLGRDKLERKIHFQIRKLKQFVSGVCKACGRPYFYPITARELGLVLSYRNKTDRTSLVIRGECSNCGFTNNLNAPNDINISDDTSTRLTINYITALMTSYAIRYSSDTRLDIDIISTGFRREEEEDETLDEDDLEWHEENGG